MFAEIFSYDRELIEQGVFEKAIKVAKRMIAKGASIEDILEITELPKKEIEQLMELNSD